MVGERQRDRAFAQRKVRPDVWPFRPGDMRQLRDIVQGDDDMSQQPETRFACDRCHDTISVAHNDQPSLERGKPPAGWVTLHINGPTTPASHLCTRCAPLFEVFMHPQDTGR